MDLLFIIVYNGEYGSMIFFTLVKMAYIQLNSCLNIRFSLSWEFRSFSNDS